MHIELRITL